MPSPHITDAPPSSPLVPAAVETESGVHRHGPSCFWQVEEARWSCDVSAPQPQGRRAPH
jgi:hypothetical protein